MAPARLLPWGIAPSDASPAYGTLLTQRERATILAALRHWQHIGMHGADPWSAIEKTEPLTETEIDKLCERIDR